MFIRASPGFLPHRALSWRLSLSIDLRFDRQMQNNESSRGGGRGVGCRGAGGGFKGGGGGFKGGGGGFKGGGGGGFKGGGGYSSGGSKGGGYSSPVPPRFNTEDGFEQGKGSGWAKGGGKGGGKGKGGGGKGGGGKGGGKGVGKGSKPFWRQFVDASDDPEVIGWCRQRIQAFLDSEEQQHGLSGLSNRLGLGFGLGLGLGFGFG